MLDRKWLGDKTKGGFYKKVKSGGRQRRRTPSPRLENSRIPSSPETKISFPRHGEKYRRHRSAPAHAARPRRHSAKRTTKPERFLWSALSDLWTYSANRVPEISDSIVEIDRAMRLGFNWELGPFELWDAAGIEPTVARMKKENKPVAANVEKLLAAGQKSWYADDPKTPSGRKYWQLTTGNWQLLRSPRRRLVSDSRKEIEWCSQEKFRSLARRSRRRRSLHRVPQQDELAGLRHPQSYHSNPETRRPRRQLRRLRHHQRRHKFFRRR